MLVFRSSLQFILTFVGLPGDDWQPQAAEALIQELVSGEAIPEIEVIPAVNLKADGAFGEDTIYLSEEFLSENAANPEAVAGVLLEEIGHYVDQELNGVDSPGDGDIFARLVQGETIAGVELTAIKAEDDSATISLNGKEIPVEQVVDEGKLTADTEPTEPSKFQGMSPDAAERWLEAEQTSSTPEYPGYN